MKINLFKSFSLLWLFYNAFCINVNAQIVYTDVNPDTTINTSGSIYPLDLNNDGIIDYNITVDFITSALNCGSSTSHINSYIKILPLDSNEVLNNSFLYPLPLSFGSVIDSNSYLWQNSASQILLSNVGYCGQIHTCCLMGPNTPCCFNGGGSTTPWLKYLRHGEWYGVNDKYLGLKFHIGLNIYYGWVRLGFSGYSVIIKEYAYNSNSNESLFAGETCWFPVNLNITGNTFFCSYDTINQHTTLTVSGGTSYLWNIADTTAGIIVSPAQTTNYSVNVSDSSTNCIAIFNQSIIIDVIDTSVTVYNYPNFTQLSAHSALSTSYQWIDCTAMIPIPGATINNYIDSLNGNYAVIISRNGCIDTSSCHSILITGNEERFPSSYLAIYSFNKSIKIKLKDVSEIRGNVIVYNMYGQELRKMKIENQSFQIDMSNYNNGIYFVTFLTNEVIETRKLYLK